MKVRRFFVAAVTAALLVPATAWSAGAAPGNDEPGGARTIATLPKTITQDTSAATTSAVDASLNELCGAPATSGSVWFKYTDTDGEGIKVDVTASSYTAGVMIVDGNPAAGGSLLACGPGISAARGPAGTTYYVMAFSDSPEVVGGTLKATFSEAPPAPEAMMTIARDAIATKGGNVRLHGTYTCTNADYGSGIEGKVVQRADRLKITGYFVLYDLQCDGDRHRWSALVVSDNGYYAPGRATSASTVFACGLIECGSYSVEKVLALSRPGE